MNAREFEALKEKVENAQRKLDRAKGSRDAGLKRLSKEFSLETFEQGEKSLAKLEKEADREEAEISKEKNALEKRWEGKL